MGYRRHSTIKCEDLARWFNLNWACGRNPLVRIEALETEHQKLRPAHLQEPQPPGTIVRCFGFLRGMASTALEKAQI
jgi:hypothetical protein